MKALGPNILRELDLHTRVTIPFSEDGANVHTATYQIVGLILHQGATHENEHYQAILAIDNVYWLADDGAYPTPLPHLSLQQRKEISQIWLVVAPTDELVTDTAIEMAEYLPKKTRTCQEFNSCNGFLPSPGTTTPRTSGPVTLKMMGPSRCLVRPSQDLALTLQDGPLRPRNSSHRISRSPSLAGDPKCTSTMRPWPAPANHVCGRKAVQPSGRRWASGSRPERHGIQNPSTCLQRA